jgi:hypothetical protein
VFPPDGCCEPCAIEIYLTISRAGKKHLTAGTMLGGAVTALFYICWQIHYLPVSVLAVVVAGFCASLAAIIWGGSVAPRLASSHFRRQFRRQPDTQRDRQLGPGGIGLPQLPEPGNSTP